MKLIITVEVTIDPSAAADGVAERILWAYENLYLAGDEPYGLGKWTATWEINEAVKR